MVRRFLALFLLAWLSLPAGAHNLGEPNSREGPYEMGIMIETFVMGVKPYRRAIWAVVDEDTRFVVLIVRFETPVEPSVLEMYRRDLVADFASYLPTPAYATLPENHGPFKQMVIGPPKLLVSLKYKPKEQPSGLPPRTPLRPSHGAMG